VTLSDLLVDDAPAGARVDTPAAGVLAGANPAISGRLAADRLVC
jgi:hypothetical protein